MNGEPHRVTLRHGVRAAILAHALDRHPDECCGLLVGRGYDVDEAVAATNISARPHVEFEIDPASHIALRRRLRGSDRVIVGAYHSHPHDPATPSPTDVARAFYTEFVWVIVSGSEFRAFRILDGQVDELAVD